MTPRPVIVHNAFHVRAACRVAAELGRGLVLHSAPGAAAAVGPGFFRDMVETGGAEYPGLDLTVVLDCGDAPGLAMNAFRQGIKAVNVSVAGEARRRLEDIAGQWGAALVDPPGESLDLLDVADAEAACREWFEQTR